MKNLHQVRPPTPTDLDQYSYYLVDIEHAELIAQNTVQLRLRVVRPQSQWFNFTAHRFYWGENDCREVNQWRDRNNGRYYQLNFEGGELIAGQNAP